MGGIIYLRLKKEFEVKPNTTIRLNDIGYISGNNSVNQLIEESVIYQVSKEDRTVSVIDGFTVIDQLVRRFSDIEIQLVGPSQTIVRIKKPLKSPSIFFVCLIWLLLFIGSSMAIMNFHYDVSMQEVQQRLHFLLTGRQAEYPLWMQVPYSIGLGVGMILFFNHLFKKRFNEEPSPLEIEMFKYQQDLDSYVSKYENNISKNNDKSSN
ncbi:stage V sporulation protein AA [Aquibacillus koreensis]|uniref:Stage V sporulation protein AA n=1 Tax=Aquibacillus koreensis TaxID=279446 RepID=A0A9X3WK62_9BACI|nr:stage V sporulation protein AA [Aquibacillus koreensis]MCT2537443.1 stage V sporulation protein AA [Aquibacillus koreensis]MDC3418889.1 stage V sporulation protein AA [Aquibacillus koreensis]